METQSKGIENQGQAGTGSSEPQAKLSFEAAFEKLQGTVKRLESGELSLEESLKSFEEGVRLTRLCQEYLASAEQRVEILMKSGKEGQADLQPFASTK